MKSFPAALLVSFLVGYLSLSLETVWIRTMDFTNGGRPETFGIILSAFLFGIAIGAFYAGKLSLRHFNFFTWASTLLVGAAFLTFFSIPFVSIVTTLSYKLGFMLALIAITLVAAALGAIFPLLCHITIKSDSAVGRKVSYLYMANIVGATLSPLFTGLYLFDRYSLPSIIITLSFVAIIASIAMLFASTGIKNKHYWLASLVMVSFALVALHKPLYSDLLARLQYKERWDQQSSFKTVFENKNGIITIEKNGSEGKDIIYGGGIYDGRFNIDPVDNSNGITRAYFIAAIHPQPKSTLEIGLSSGSWARVLDDYSNIELLEIVEINPGYEDVINNYPEQKSIFDSGKIEIYYDDGRRWLKRNPERKFDLILMNTTWHFRSNTTNLLSAEFLHLVRSHLNPGGVFYYNTTGSLDIIYTASNVFEHIVKFGNFIAASDAGFSLTQKEIENNLLQFVHNGAPIFLTSNEHKGLMKTLSHIALDDLAPEFRGKIDLTEITDNNMVTEFKPKRLKSAVPWIELIKNMKGT